MNSEQPDAVTVEQARSGFSHHEQMLDAQNQCVPCKLCGSKALITDAGTGAGYYIACSNSQSFRPFKGCLIDERRVSGWAYNVMDWWNSLHRLAALDEGKRLAASDREADEDLMSPADAWQEIVEYTDRTSPEEYPEMALITMDELAWFMDHALARPVEAPDSALREAGQRFLQLKRSIMIDVGSCHSMRGSGASQEMKSDDRDMREDIEKAYAMLAAALSATTPGESA